MTHVLLRALAVGLAMALSFGLLDAQTAPAHQPSEDLTIVSLNLAMRGDVDRIATELQAIEAERADVMVLQEVARDARGETNVAHQLGERLGLNTVYREAPGRDDEPPFGLAVLSRLPVTDARVLALKRFNLTFTSRDRMALVVTVDTPDGPLRICNVHLDTRINTGDRLDQVSGIVEELARSPGRAIVAGDFNTNDYLWLFHTIPLPAPGRQATGLEQFMAKHGLHSVFEDGPTHDALRMRLDWVFVRGLRATARSIHPVDVSDHHALVVSVRNSALPGPAAIATR